VRHEWVKDKVNDAVLEEGAIPLVVDGVCVQVSFCPFCFLESARPAASNSHISTQHCSSENEDEDEEDHVLPTDFNLLDVVFGVKCRHVINLKASIKGEYLNSMADFSPNQPFFLYAESLAKEFLHTHYPFLTNTIHHHLTVYDLLKVDAEESAFQFIICSHPELLSDKTKRQSLAIMSELVLERPELNLATLLYLDHALQHKVPEAVPLFALDDLPNYADILEEDVLSPVSLKKLKLAKSRRKAYRKNIVLAESKREDEKILAEAKALTEQKKE
jgi:hypothetical protein